MAAVATQTPPAQAPVKSFQEARAQAVDKHSRELAATFVPPELVSRALQVIGISDMLPKAAVDFFHQQLGIPFEDTTGLAQCLAVCAEFKLNPLLKHIYGFKNKNGQYVPIVGIDGWLHIANQHPQFDGMDIEFKDDAAGNPVSCVCKLYRKDRTRPTVVEEFLSENRMNTDPWSKRPRRMLSHRARAQAVRSAFGVSGVWHDMEPEEVRELEDAQVKSGPRPSDVQAERLARLAAKPVPALPNRSAESVEYQRPATATVQSQPEPTPDPDHDPDIDATEPLVDGPLTDAEKAAILRAEAEEAERAEAARLAPVPPRSLTDLQEHNRTRSAIR